MIDIKGLYKSFDDKTVLSDINATFENGKTNLIIGQSGSGKTVLMKCIVGLLTPEKGEVLYDGRNLVLMGKKEKKMLRKEMGMIFQSAALFDSMSVLDNVMFPLNMFSNDTLRDRTKRAMCQPVRSERQVSRRNQWRYAETCSYCTCYFFESAIFVLRRAELGTRPENLIGD